MTTFRSDAAGAGGLCPPRRCAAHPPGYWEPKRRGALALVAGLALAAPAAAQEIALPSGHAAVLYDVVLEDAGAVMAPDAGVDPESLPEGGGEAELPLDVDPGAVEGVEEEALDDGVFVPDEAPVEPAPPDEAGEEAFVAAEPGASAGGIARFRLTVAGLGREGAAYDDLAPDFAWLCAQVALPALAANGWTATEVVVALSDREVPFGTPDPEAVQFFEGFRIEGGTCVPQAF